MKSLIKQRNEKTLKTKKGDSRKDVAQCCAKVATAVAGCHD